MWPRRHAEQGSVEAKTSVGGRCPGNLLLQPVWKNASWRESGRLAEPRDVEHDISSGFLSRVLLESGASPREAEHRGGRVADGDARAGADVVRAREPAFPRRDDRPRGVIDVQIVAQLLAAEDADRLTQHGSADEVRDGSLDGVPAAVEHGEAQDRDVHLVAMFEGAGEDLRRDLARTVPAHRPQLGVLAKRLVALGKPVHLGRARNDVRLARTTKGAEEVHGS